MDDVTAKKSFSRYGYTELWTRAIKRPFFLQSKVNVDGLLSLWPTKETRIDRTEESTVILVERQRCDCQCWIAFSIQCEHECIMNWGLDIFSTTMDGIIYRPLINFCPTLLPSSILIEPCHIFVQYLMHRTELNVN
jgi:hypothetical protein